MRKRPGDEVQGRRPKGQASPRPAPTDADFAMLEAFERVFADRREAQQAFAAQLFWGPRAEHWDKDVVAGFRDWLSEAGPAMRSRLLASDCSDWDAASVAEKREALVVLLEYFSATGLEPLARLARDLRGLAVGETVDYLQARKHKWGSRSGFAVFEARLRLLEIREFAFATKKVSRGTLNDDLSAITGLSRRTLEGWPATLRQEAGERHFDRRMESAREDAQNWLNYERALAEDATVIRYRPMAEAIVSKYGRGAVVEVCVSLAVLARESHVTGARKRITAELASAKSVDVFPV